MRFISKCPSPSYQSFFFNVHDNNNKKKGNLDYLTSYPTRTTTSFIDQLGKRKEREIGGYQVRFELWITSFGGILKLDSNHLDQSQLGTSYF